jgi:hypothetical protein
VRHWRLHYWPCHIVANTRISKVSRASNMAKTNCDYSVLVVPWLPPAIYWVELGPRWNLAVRARRDYVLLL